MNKTISALTALLFFTSLAIAQETRFFMPKEIVAAYENGTRSYDGNPGPAYWQNKVDYTIAAEVDPVTRTLTGSETITFQNNSPDDLRNIIIRLYQDVFRKGNDRSSRVLETDINDGMTISNLKINGSPVDMEQNTRRQGTNMYVQLPEALENGNTMTIELDWSMVIPETTVRMGAYDSTSFFVSYWYPQVAVYDDVFGWDNLSYDFSTEFYNNIGDFDVTLTAPENFTVVATGILKNAEDVFTRKHLKRYQEAYSSTETVTIISEEDIENGVKHKSGSWHYTADNVTDFSFCLSDHFIYDAAIQKVDGRNVLVASYYNVKLGDEAMEAAKKLTQVQRKSMDKMSTEMPGVPYPYPEFTTCVMGVGGGGMETPMMANNGGPGIGVTIHEMFHTYFPLYVRVNEKRFAWMDEGWASFNDEYIARRYFEEDSSLFITDYGYLEGTIGSISDLPLITSTQFMDNTNYGYASYPLPAFIYNMLHHHLGEEMFRKCYKTYIERWAEKSPTPYDFFYSFEDVSGEDLSWLWKPWFFSYGYVDVSISSFENGTLNLTNKGNRPVPVVIEGKYEDGNSFFLDYSAGKWEDSNTFTVDLPNASSIVEFSVNQSIPDAGIMDNFYPTLTARMADFEINEDIPGTYQLKEYPLQASIEQEDNGLLRLTIRNTTISGYILPETDNVFKSLDGSFTCTIGDEGSMTLELTSLGVTLTGSKQ